MCFERLWLYKVFLCIFGGKPIFKGCSAMVAKETWSIFLRPTSANVWLAASALGGQWTLFEVTKLKQNNHRPPQTTQCSRKPKAARPSTLPYGAGRLLGRPKHLPVYASATLCTTGGSIVSLCKQINFWDPISVKSPSNSRQQGVLSSERECS